MSRVWADLVWLAFVTLSGVESVVSDAPPMVVLFWGIMIGCYIVFTAVDYGNVRSKRQRSRLLP